MTYRTITSPDALIPVDIMIFRRTTRDISFDLYLKLSPTNIAHVFSRTTGLDYKRLAQYIQKGVKQLFIHPDDLEIYQQFIARPAEVIFQDPATSTEKKIATLLNMTEQNMAEVFTHLEIDEETAQSTQKIIKNYVDIMVQTPETLTLILKLVSHGDYLYYHSISVSILSMFLAKSSGQFNQKLLETVGLGGFLHDIGCTQLPKEIVCSPTDFKEEQWAEMKTHTKLGMKMIEKTSNISDEVRYIVYQHHEEPSGNGYPNNLRSSVIYYPAKIVAIADGFSALVSKRPFRPAYSVEESLKIIQDNIGKYDKDLVALLIAKFSPLKRRQKPAA